MAMKKNSICFLFIYIMENDKIWNVMRFYCADEVVQFLKSLKLMWASLKIELLEMASKQKKFEIRNE